MATRSGARNRTASAPAGAASPYRAAAQAPLQPADALQEAAAQQGEFVMEQFACLVQACEQAAALALDAQSAWIKGLETWALFAMKPLITGQDVATASAQPVLGSPADSSPMGMFNAAAGTWTEWTKAWADALVHDLHNAARPRA